MEPQLTGIIVGLSFVGLFALASLGDERDRICRPGFARSIRPPEAVTERIKAKKAYYLCTHWEDAPADLRTVILVNTEQGASCVEAVMRSTELDHICPLCMGCPSTEENFQLQPWNAARKKDELEKETCISYCDGEIEYPEAVGRFHREYP